MKKLIAFDLDGTLAESKSPAEDRIIELLNRLLDNFQVCVISGGKFEQFKIQLLSNLKCSPEKLVKLHLMPTCGTQYYTFDSVKADWQQVYAENFTEEQKTKITKVVAAKVEELGFDKQETYGEQIEDRGSQVSWSAFGQDIVTQLGLEGVRRKEEWDPDHSKKTRLREAIAAQIPEFEVRTGGGTTIDITKPGIDKAYGMQKLMNELSIGKQDILFLGDKLQEGGNDYPVKAMGIDSIEVSHWRDTANVLQGILHIL